MVVSSAYLRLLIFILAIFIPACDSSSPAFSINLRYTDDTTLVTESEEALKSLLIKMKEESEKAGLEVNFQKAEIMASHSVTSWQIDGETMETVRDFILGASKSLQ